jgi:hypothetical protein
MSMHRRFAASSVAALSVLLFLRVSPATACPQLPDGLRASVRAVNLSRLFPANGAIVLHLTCWHDCTPCEAAAQVVDVDLRDDTGRAIYGAKPEQVFLSDKPLEHLVIWRPLESLEVGGRYQAQVSVVGQPDSTSSDFVVIPAMPVKPIEQMFVWRAAAYREDRGTIFHCDTSQNDCDSSTLSFGDQFAMLPELVIQADAASGAQLLFRVRDKTISVDSSWQPWTGGGETLVASLAYREKHDTYCADVEARSLVDASTKGVFSVCAPHGNLAAPMIFATDPIELDTQLHVCHQPPAELQDRWCAYERSCAGGCCSGACGYVDDYCGANPRKGSSATQWVEPQAPPPMVEEGCENPRDPYELVAGGGCQSGRGRPAAPASALLLLGLVARVRRRRHLS